MQRANNLSNYGAALTRVASGDAPMSETSLVQRQGPAVQAAVPSGNRAAPWQATSDAYSADYPVTALDEPADAAPSVALSQIND